jgi:hypothetical protein
MASSPQQGQAQGGGGVCPAEQFWTLLDKADRRFARVRDLPLFGRQEPEEYGKAFRIYTRLWRAQQEHRHRLLDAGLRRWQVGEIAARIAHLYYSQYQRGSDTALLSEAFVFYHAVLDRGYFLDDHLGPASTKHLRFLARFLLVALILARRAHTVPLLATRIRALLDESKKTLQVHAILLLFLPRFSIPMQLPRSVFIHSLTQIKNRRNLITESGSIPRKKSRGFSRPTRPS